MMHHVCGDLNTPETLFIPQVLETFSDIWERVSITIICDIDQTFFCNISLS